MSTQVLSKEVPIEEFVAGLRRFAEPAFGHVDQILGFVKSTPVAPDTLRPYLTWDRQHSPETSSTRLHFTSWLQSVGRSGRSARYTIIASRIVGWQCLSAACWLKISGFSPRISMPANAAWSHQIHAK